MRKILILAAILIFAPIVFAYDNSDVFETKQQAYDRQSYNNYNAYKNNNNEPPRGGYQHTLGTTTSGEQYGYSNRNNNQNGYNNNNHNNSYNAW